MPVADLRRGSFVDATVIMVANPSMKVQGRWCRVQVQKSYRTVVGGRLEGRGYVDIPLDGKPSLTEYRAVSQTGSGNHGCISTVDLYPHTGGPQTVLMALWHRQICPHGQSNFVLSKVQC